MSKPAPGSKRSKFFGMNTATAAKKNARRRAGRVRPAKSGGQKRRVAVRGTWMRGWPEQRTEKQGKNRGRAPKYTSAMRPGDHGQRPPPKGQGWPYPDSVKPKEM